VLIRHEIPVDAQHYQSFSCELQAPDGRTLLEIAGYRPTTLANATSDYYVAQWPTKEPTLYVVVLAQALHQGLLQKFNRPLSPIRYIVQSPHELGSYSHGFAADKLKNWLAGIMADEPSFLRMDTDFFSSSVEEDTDSRIVCFSSYYLLTGILLAMWKASSSSDLGALGNFESEVKDTLSSFPEPDPEL
jgi:hypothetical protein